MLSRWGSIFTDGFDSLEDFPGRGGLGLGRADPDPQYRSLGADEKDRRVRDSEGVDAKHVVDTIGLDDFALFVEENRKRIVVCVDKLSPAEHALALLGGNESDLDFPRLEFLPIYLELRQLPAAVGSPGAAQEDDQERLSTQLRG